MPLRRVLDGLGGLSKRTLDVLNPFLANAHHTGLNPPVPTTKLRNDVPEDLVEGIHELSWIPDNAFGIWWDDLGILDVNDPTRLRVPYRGRYRITVNLKLTQYDPELANSHFLMNMPDLHFHGRSSWGPTTLEPESASLNDANLNETTDRGTVQLQWTNTTETDTHGAVIPAGLPHVHLPEGVDTTLMFRPVSYPYEAGAGFLAFPLSGMRLKVLYSTSDTSAGNMRAEALVHGLEYNGGLNETNFGELNVPIEGVADRTRLLTLDFDPAHSEHVSDYPGKDVLVVTLRREGTDSTNDTHTGDISVWAAWLEYDRTGLLNSETSYFNEIGASIRITRYTVDPGTGFFVQQEDERFHFANSVSSLMSFKDGDYFVVSISTDAGVMDMYTRSRDEATGEPIQYTAAIFDRILSVEYLGPQVLLPSDTPA